ncbi:MAG: methyltransferase domain-containing protein [Candidatus Omnitrophota bacterium]
MKTETVKRNKIITRDWFNQWSNQYDQTLGRISYHLRLLDLLVKNSGVKDNDKILDLGCGTGLLSLKLLEKADCYITGIDNSKEMISIFKEKIKKLKLEDRINCLLMDLDSLNFQSNSFDLITSSVALHHLKDKLTPLKRLHKFLKPKGILFIAELDMDTTGRHTDIKRLKRILKVLEQEWVPALKDAGVEAFNKMYFNGIKHILNQGDYCLSLNQWASICRRVGFSKVSVKRVPKHKAFGIVVAKK